MFEWDNSQIENPVKRNMIISHLIFLKQCLNTNEWY